MKVAHSINRLLSLVELLYIKFSSKYAEGLQAYMCTRACLCVCVCVCVCVSLFRTLSKMIFDVMQAG